MKRKETFMSENSNETAVYTGPLKLNYKRTFIIGFAFFGILLLWQVYDSWCPTFLTELFKSAFNTENEKEVQYLVRDTDKLHITI